MTEPGDALPSETADAWERVRALFGPSDEDSPVVDELLAERRAEAEREQ